VSWIPRLLTSSSGSREEGDTISGVVADLAANAYAETVDATTYIQVFGTPSNAVVEMLRRQAGAGVPLSVKPHRLGGFTRA